MSELERNLRNARDALGEPPQTATEQAHRAVLDAAVALRPGPHRERSRQRRRAVVAAITLAAVIGAAFAGGFFVAPTGASDEAAEVDGPGFLPAAGWETFQTGITAPPRAPSATAANTSLGADVFSGTFPWETIGRLEQGEVLLQATFLPAGESEAVDEQFPQRELPLSLEDAQTDAQMEGQPANVAGYRLLAQVRGLNIDLFVFFGDGEPTAEARAAAQDELARLVVPQQRQSSASARTSTSRGTCEAANLRARVRVKRAGERFAGHISFLNVASSPCTLEGRPEVELRDVNGALIESTQGELAPAWQQASAQQPRAWPTVRLAQRSEAQALLELRNWCGTAGERVSFHIRLPGQVDRMLASVSVLLPCENPQAPVELSVGPFEPRRMS